MDKIEKAKIVISKIEAFFFNIAIIIMTAVTVYAVIMRYVFSSPIGWAEEIQYITVVWAAFFGGSMAFRKRANISVDYFYLKFNKTVKLVFEIVIWIVLTLSLAWITKLEFNRVAVMIKKHQTTTILHIPNWIGYGGVCFGCLFMFINHVLNGIEDVIKYRGGKK